jgi:Ca-activated chloride channel family protein
MQIDPRQRGKLPKVEVPVNFQTKDGRFRGWKATLPGKRPLATPAVADGRVFLGGGFGSYEFYALDAVTGRLDWQYQTTDDGPTAAVAWDGYVVFSTESCEIEVLRSNGRPVWKKWLGDPLMSMPAVAQGRVYASFPDSRGDRQHHLAAFDLYSGREIWRQRIDAEVITAPVLANEQIYLTNLEGIVFCFRQQDGATAWRAPKDATSSPMVWNRECYFSRRREEEKGPDGKRQRYQTEHVASRGLEPDSATKTYMGTAGLANYLDHAKRMRGSPRYAFSAGVDASVGFAGHKGDAKMFQAMKHLGKGHVHEIWAYQGSKPFVHRGRLYSALGDTLHCVDPATQEVYWKKRLGPDSAGSEMLDSILTPPATVNGKLYLGSLLGDVYCLCAATGDELWRFHVDEAVVFQPAVAQGRVYIPTDGGSLYCLETGDQRDDGWCMWGGTAAHNGLAE